jgi:hypothetical protein
VLLRRLMRHGPLRLRKTTIKFLVTSSRVVVEAGRVQTGYYSRCLVRLSSSPRHPSFPELISSTVTQHPPRGGLRASISVSPTSEISHEVSVFSARPGTPRCGIGLGTLLIHGSAKKPWQTTFAHRQQHPVLR